MPEGLSMTGKTIRLFLADGAPTGVLTAEIINWTGKVIVAPRSQLSSLAKRDEIKRTGVYCLVGPDPDAPHRDCVYIGEGDNVLTRLTAHDKDKEKDFWTRTVVITSKDENITKSHGRYLESRLVTIAQEAGRAVVVNGTAPPVNPLPEPDVADMEYFLDQIRLILPVLGFLFLQPKPEYSELIATGELTPRFVMRDAGTLAYAIEANGEFVVLKDSTARKTGTKSWHSYYRDLRDQLVQDGKLIDSGQPNYFKLVENVPFASPSASATVVAAGNRNGRSAWKVESTGQTYAAWHDAKLAAVGNVDVKSG